MELPALQSSQALLGILGQKLKELKTEPKNQRSASEIADEETALKLLRGKLSNLTDKLETLKSLGPHRVAEKAVTLPQVDAARRELLAAARENEKRILFGKEAVSHIFSFCELQHTTADSAEPMAPRQGATYNLQADRQPRRTKEDTQWQEPDQQTKGQSMSWTTPWAVILDQPDAATEVKPDPMPASKLQQQLRPALKAVPAVVASAPAPAPSRANSSRLPKPPANAATNGNHASRAAAAAAAAAGVNPVAEKPVGARSSDCNIMARLKQRVATDGVRTEAVVAALHRSREGRASVDGEQRGATAAKPPNSPGPSTESELHHVHMDHPREDSSMCNMAESADCNAGAVCSYRALDGDGEVSSNNTSLSTLDLPAATNAHLSASRESALRPKRLDYPQPQTPTGALADTVSSRSKKVVISGVTTVISTRRESSSTSQSTRYDGTPSATVTVLEREEEEVEEEVHILSGPYCDSWDSAITLNNYATDGAPCSDARTQAPVGGKAAEPEAYPVQPRHGDATSGVVKSCLVQGQRAAPKGGVAACGEDQGASSKPAKAGFAAAPAAWQLLQQRQVELQKEEQRMFRALGISADREGSQDRCSTSSIKSDATDLKASTASAGRRPRRRPRIFRLIRSVVGTVVGTAVMTVGMTFAAAAVNTGLDELEHPAHGGTGKATSRPFNRPPHVRSAPSAMLGRG